MHTYRFIGLLRSNTDLQNIARKVGTALSTVT